MTKIILRNKQTVVMLVSMCVLLLQGGCTNYLSLKPDQKLTVPQKEEDLLAVLSDVQVMNYSYAGGLAELGSDNVFIPYESWTSIFNEMDRMTHVWGRIPVTVSYWNPGYAKVLACNTVLDLIDDVDFLTIRNRDEIRGIASFFRGYTFFDLVQVFAPAYDESSANDKLGIVLRLSSDINVKSTRALLQETYEQIITDLKHAVAFLPDDEPMYPTRPNKFAAYGALARVYLTMGKFTEAKLYADSCLMGHSELLDYNDYPKGSNYPFERFNKEVIFYSQLNSYSTMLSESRARISPDLLRMYDEIDLRKSLFFTMMPDGLFSFTGDYGQNNNTAKFNGITRAEMLLIRAECLTRAKKMSEGLNDINTFLLKRYERNLFIPLKGDIEQKDLLRVILAERRKELIYRGIRWSDLRRLESEYVNTVTRLWEEEEYQMGADELKYFAFLIPNTVIERSGIEQN